MRWPSPLATVLLPAGPLAQRGDPLRQEADERGSVDRDGDVRVRLSPAPAEVDVRPAAPEPPGAVDLDPGAAHLEQLRPQRIRERDRIVHGRAAELRIAEG